MFARESKKQMADRRKLSLGNEEKLSFQVKKFPCLFDKTDKGYKEKDCTSNAWKAVADSLDFLTDGKFEKLLIIIFNYKLNSLLVL